jgi:hypothetical protein
MIKKHIFITFIFFFSISSFFAQSFKLNQVSPYELKMTHDSVFAEAPAIVLERNVKVDVSNWVEVYERIKTLNEDGLDYATINFPYYSVFKIKGNTYNIENGEIVISKLTNDMRFTEKVERFGTVLKDQKAAFPNVKVGSVIEIYYKATKGTFSDIVMQYDIPIKKLNVEIENSSGSNFSVVQNPRAVIQINSQKKKKKISFSSSNIPPLEHEDFVFDMELYRAKVILKKIGYVGSSVRIDKWSDLAKIVSGISVFAKNVKPIFKEEISTLITGVKDPLERSQLIYNYIKGNIEWNKNIGIFPSTYNETTYNQKIGNVSDINMLLVSVFKTAGIESYPVLASTKMNGIQLTASQESFDYLLAGAKILDKWYVFDAAHPKSSFEYIPEFMLNWKGMIIKNGADFEWVDLTKSNLSKQSVIAIGTIDEELNLIGQVQERQTGYFGIRMKSLLNDDIIEKKDLIGFSEPGLNFENIEIKDISSSNVSDMSYNFDFKDGIEELSNNLYVSPLSFLSTKNSPFKNDVRQFPVDFGFPQSTEYVFTITIPDDYKVTYIPEPIRIAMPNKMGSYYYNVINQGSQLKVLMKFEIYIPIIQPEFYQGLKEFFNARVEKENEKIVLQKV